MADIKKRKIEFSSNPEVWKKWLNELDQESEDNIGDSDYEETDQVDGSDHNSETDQSADEDGDFEGEDNVTSYGKNGVTKWDSSLPKKNVRTRRENIITHLPGPKGIAAKLFSPKEILNLFIDEHTYKIIVECTNIYIDSIKCNYERDRDARPTNVTEIKALFGLLLLIGTYKSSRTNIQKLWDNSRGNGLESCYLTMSRNRFSFLLRCLRFDDIRDRASRREFDKFAPIRNVFEIINNNFSKYFIPSEYLTVDEQLLAFRGNCPFRQYMPRKPSKYGIKTFALVDAKMAYTMNLETYLGNQPEGPFRQSNSASDVVMRLVEPIKGSHRNITTDNWFTSYPLAKNLLSNGITIVGTLRKNKTEIPKEFQPNKVRQPGSSLFGFQNDVTLVSYCSKKKQAVLVLSTLHHDDNIDVESGDLMKPEIITFYNRTKIGVDLVDQLIQNYDVSRSTRRWPLVVFFNLLNISAINALIIFKLNQKKSIKRNKFLEDLAWDLIKPQIEFRSKIQQIPIELRRRACILLGQTLNDDSTLRKPESTKGRCYSCGRQRDKTTRKWCEKCGKWICNEHLKNVCENCL